MAKKEKQEFLNPLTPGVTYKEFLAAIPEGTTIKEYCGEHLSKGELAWIENEVEQFKKSNK